MEKGKANACSRHTVAKPLCHHEKEAERQAKVKQLVSEGTQAFDVGAYDLAIQRWEEALRLSPNELGVQKSIDTAEQKQREKQRIMEAWARQQAAQKQAEKSNEEVRPPPLYVEGEQGANIFSWMVAGIILLLTILLLIASRNI